MHKSTKLQNIIYQTSIRKEKEMFKGLKTTIIVGAVICLGYTVAMMTGCGTAPGHGTDEVTDSGYIDSLYSDTTFSATISGVKFSTVTGIDTIVVEDIK